METKSNTQEIFDAGITVTEKAAQRLAAVMEAEDKKGFGLRMEVTSGGCSGMNYNMSFEKEQKEFDKVFESKSCLAFNDIAPKTPIHVLVIPKGEYVSFQDFSQKASAEEQHNFFKTVGEIAEKLNLPQDGYRLIMNTNKNGGQEVPHFHVHILGGKPVGPMVCS